MNMQNRPTGSCCQVDIEQCDTFTFMAKVIGLPILHPGGLRANDEMIRMTGMSKDSSVLDVACGKGTNACYFVRKTGCQMTAIDCDEPSIIEAKTSAAKQGLEKKIVFQTADAARLPYAEDVFTTVILQALLIMVDEPQKVLAEAIRVMKPGGRIAILELAWKKEPPPGFFPEAESFCRFFRHVETFEGWKKKIFRDGLLELHSQLYDMACPCSFGELGLRRALKIFLKQTFKGQVRKRMNQMDRFIGQNDEYFGYGIYMGEKTAA